MNGYKRPREKLHEELPHEGEHIGETAHPKTGISHSGLSMTLIQSARRVVRILVDVPMAIGDDIRHERRLIDDRHAVDP